MPYLDSMDPGKATGYARGYYDDKTPYELSYAETLDQDGTFELLEDVEEYVNIGGEVTFVVEGFRLQGGLEFTPDLTGVEIIGAIKLLRIPTIWQWRTDKALVPDRVLKDGGLWQTGKTVGWSTGRHANDAIIHALVYLLRQNHRPTVEKYFGG